MVERGAGKEIPTEWPERSRVPDSHPVSFDQAYRLVNGQFGAAAKDFVLGCCLPLFWYRKGDKRILHNGTVTVVQTAKCLLGLTAEHVLDQYAKDCANGPTALQLGEATLNAPSIIDASSELDLATFEIPRSALNGQSVTPLDWWPPMPPVEGRGILLAGFPGLNRSYPQSTTIEWEPFAAIAVARTVSERQITVLVERGEFVTNDLPAFANLGGVSGGPIIGAFESPSFVLHYVLSGIITEHPQYETGGFGIERLVGVRADCVTESGRIRR